MDEAVVALGGFLVGGDEVPFPEGVFGVGLFHPGAEGFTAFESGKWTNRMMNRGGSKHFVAIINCKCFAKDA